MDDITAECEYEGELLFNHELMASQLLKIQQILDKNGLDPYPLQINSTFSGIEWDGNDTTEIMTHLRFFQEELKKTFSSVTIAGRLLAREVHGMRTWVIQVYPDRDPEKNEVPVQGVVKCPNCQYRFPWHPIQ